MPMICSSVKRLVRICPPPERRSNRFPSSLALFQGAGSARRKQETVLRLLRGEDLELVSRELAVTAAELSGWRDQFLAGGEASLKSRPADARDAEIGRLQAKVGELTMTAELLEAKIERLEVLRPLPRRRSRR